MSVHAAYKKLMECGAPSKEDVILQGMCREWIWEFLLKHCSNGGLLRALAGAYPIPDSSLHLKRLLLLKSLSFNVSENHFSDRTLETISTLSSLYLSDNRSPYFHVPVTTSDGKKDFYQFSLRQLHLAVRVECTIQYLRVDTDDWPKFLEALEKYWGDFADDTQEPERNEDDDDAGLGDTFSELKAELWSVQKQPELRHDLLKRRKREYMMQMMQSFLSDAWKDVELVFLDGVVHNLKKGVYVPDGVAPRTDVPSTEEASAKSSPRPVDVLMAKDSSEGVHKPHGSLPARHVAASVATCLRTRVSMPHDSLAQNASTMKEGSSRLIVGSASKDLEGPHLPCRPSLESLVNSSNINDPGTSMGCTEKTWIEQEHMQRESSLSSKRRMPMSLKEKRKELELLSFNMDVLRAVKRDQPRATMSSLRADKSLPVEKGTFVRDGSSDHGQKPPNKVVSEVPSLKDTCGSEVRKTCLTVVTKQRDEGVNNLEQEEPVCLSPPPWAGEDELELSSSFFLFKESIPPGISGSPGLNDTVTVCKRAKLTAHASETVAAVGGKENVETPVILRAQSELREVRASLNAVVQDPLPGALKIAEEATKTSDLVRRVREQTVPVDDRNQGILAPSENNHHPTFQVVEGIVQKAQEKPSKKSIMDRNPSAHTIQWETSDDIADGSDDKSPSRSRQIHLPRLRTRQSFAGQGGITARKEPHRRKFRRWTQEEENVLRKEVERYGKGHWKHILQKHKDIFESRTEVDLKDKWRNIERREGIL